MGIVFVMIVTDNMAFYQRIKKNIDSSILTFLSQLSEKYDISEDALKEEWKEFSSNKKKNTNKKMSAYQNFCKERRPELKKEHPDISFGQLSKMLGAEWRDMEASKKKEYEVTKNKESDSPSEFMKTSPAKIGSLTSTPEHNPNPFATMNLKELKQECKKRGLIIKNLKKKEIIDLLLHNTEENDDDDSSPNLLEEEGEDETLLG